jgi:hypothetical protein
MRTWPSLLFLGLLASACNPPPVSGSRPGSGGGAAGGAGGTAAQPDAATAPPMPPPRPPSFTVPDGGGAADVPLPCTGLQCQQQSCPGGGTTSLSGTVYAPNGKLPLYNVAVYVPNAPLDPLVQGVTCDRCGTLASGKPVASALTNQEGKFKINNVPVGTGIPVVFQVGKWRRKIVVPEVKACVDTPLADPELTRLPRNRREGDMPRVAVTTGMCDQLGCLIPKLGVDPAEIGVAGQDRAFVYYRGFSDTLGPPNMEDAPTTLWRRPDELKKYDMILNSCLCGEQQIYKGPASFEAVTRWVDSGGRMFGSHFSYDWFKFSPDARWNAAMRPRVGYAGRPQSPIKIDTSFPKGKALADWMKFIDPGVTYGEVAAPEVFDNMSGTAAQVWATSTTNPGAPPGTMPPPTAMPIPNRPRFLTMNAPVGEPAEKQCGKLVHLDVHVTAENLARPAPGTFPAGCGTALNKAEHVLAFFIFDLAACIQEDVRPPVPPPIE